MQKTQEAKGHHTMKYLIALSMLFLASGCSKDATVSYSNEKVACLQMMEHEAFNSTDPNVLFRAKYPGVFVIPIIPRSTEYHARELMRSMVLEEVAYHIIAIGLLGEETPEVKEALNCARTLHGGKPVPQSFDWPDLVEHFKEEVMQNPNHEYYADVPGSRGIHFFILISECLQRIENKGDEHGLF